MKKNLLLVLAFLCSIYFLNDWPSWNTSSRVALPLSIVKQGTISIDAYAEHAGDRAVVDGVPYSDKAPLPGLLLVPVVQVLDWCGALEGDVHQQLSTSILWATLFLSALPFFLLIYFTYSDRLRSRADGLLLANMAFFGSFIFVLAGDAWSHIIAALFLMLSFRFLTKEHFFLAGIFIGAAVASEYNLVLFALLFGAFLLLKVGLKPAIFFLLGTLPFAFFLIGFNYAITGEWFELTYKYQENFKQNAEGYGFGTFHWDALWHMSFSPYRGMFFYAPFLLLSTLFIFRSKIKRTSFENLALLSFIVSFLLLCFNESWFGGWTYGPRYLVPSIALFLYVFLNRVPTDTRRQRGLFLCFSVFALLISLSGKLLQFSAPSGVLFPHVDEAWPALKEGRINPSGLLSFMGVDKSLSLLVFVALFASLLVILTINWQSERKKKPM